MTIPDEHAFLELVDRIKPGATLRNAWNLAGGVSAQVTALEVRLPDGDDAKWIVRRHGEIDRAANPNIARDEFRLLEIVRHHGVKAPRPVFLDQSRDLFPAPLLVVEFVEGNRESVPLNPNEYIEQVTGELVKIHAITDAPLLSFLPRQTQGFNDPPPEPDESMQEGRIRAALESAGLPEQVNPDVLLHGDFWPGNLLWQDERLAAVIDWEDARVGDPLSDLGNTRMEILFELGETVMEAFTMRYHSLTGIDLTNLPWWDLAAALRPCGRLAGWGLEPEDESRMRERHAWFVDRAIERLAARR